MAHRRSSKLRRETIIRDNCCCQKCGSGIELVRLEVHHIVPLYLGGADDLANLVALCERCHKEAPDLSPERRDDFAAWLNQPAGWVIAAAVESGSADPVGAARFLAWFGKSVKQGLANDSDDLAEFLPYISNQHPRDFEGTTDDE